MRQEFPGRAVVPLPGAYCEADKGGKGRQQQQKCLAWLRARVGACVLLEQAQG